MRQLIKRYLAFFIYIVTLSLAGCAGNEPTQPEYHTVKVEGKVFNSISFNDIFTQNAAVSNATVDIYRIGINGNTKVNVNSAVTGSDGKFLLETEFEGNQDYLVVARKDDKLWKTVVKTVVENEVTIFIQPLTGESTAEAEVYLAAKRKFYNLAYHDISLLVNGKTAATILDNPGYADLTADYIFSAIQGRMTAFNSEYFDKNNLKYSLFLKYGEDVQTKFARDLHFAQSQGAVQTLIQHHHESFVDALLSADLNSDKVINLLEIYYRLLITRAFDNEDLRLELTRSAALLKATIITNTYSSHLQTLNGGKKIKEIKNAGQNLILSINSETNNLNNIKASLTSYQKTVLDNLFKISGMSSTLKNSIEQRILMNLENLSSTIENNTDPYVLVSSFVEYYLSVSSEVKNLLKYTYSDDSDCIAEMMIMLYINF
jgi:hypothetical protein